MWCSHIGPHIRLQCLGTPQGSHCNLCSCHSGSVHQGSLWYLQEFVRGDVFFFSVWFSLGFLGVFFFLSFKSYLPVLSTSHSAFRDCCWQCPGYHMEYWELNLEDVHVQCKCPIHSSSIAVAPRTTLVPAYSLVAMLAGLVPHVVMMLDIAVRSGPESACFVVLEVPNSRGSRLHYYR